MADNVDITPGVGVTVAADEVGGVKLQRIKLVEGADGSNDGDISAANPLPVQPISGQVGVAANSGVVGALTQRFVHAVDVGTSVNIMGGSIVGITDSIAVHVLSTNGTMGVNVGKVDGTVAVFFSPAQPYFGGIRDTIAAHILSTNGTMAVNVGKVDGTVTVRFDPGYTLGSIQNINNSVAVHLLSTGGTIGVDVGKIDSTVAVYLQNTAGSLGVRVGQIDGSVAVYFSPSRPVVLADIQGTQSIFTVSGSTSGGTTSGVTLVLPSANASFKVFAYSIQTTGAVSSAWRFTNGAGSETEFWRPLVTASGVTGVQGAVLAQAPGNPIFQTGVSTTLALKSDTGSLVHYSVSFTKESA